MKKSTFLMSVAFVFTLFISSMSEARLIVRGGATTNIGGNVDVLALAPIMRPQFIDGTNLEIPDGFIEDLSQVDIIQEVRPNNNNNAPVPFANRASTQVPESERCDPTVCEYIFDINDPFQLQGFSTLFGSSKGVVASYKWAVFGPRVPFVDALGNNRFMNGEEITSFAATDFQDTGNGLIDVFLDVEFPVVLSPGAYQLALVSVFQAPTGQEFGVLDENVTIQGSGPNGDFVLTSWESLGATYEFETLRYDLTLTTVSAPSLIVFSGLMIAFVGLRRRT